VEKLLMPVVVIHWHRNLDIGMMELNMSPSNEEHQREPDLLAIRWMFLLDFFYLLLTSICLFISLTIRSVSSLVNLPFI
jgi:hypothetical protein